MVVSRPLHSQPTHMWRLHSGPVTTENAEQRSSDRWTGRQTAAAVAIAVLVGGLGGAAIYAATEGSPRAMGAGARTQMHVAPGGQGPAAPRQAPPAVAPAQPPGTLHSEYVVSDGNGGFATKMSQTGVVDEVTLSQIVVRSDDGFTQIYSLPSASVPPDKPVSANDTVTVEATRTGTTLTLNRIEGHPPAN